VRHGFVGHYRRNRLVCMVSTEEPKMANFSKQEVLTSFRKFNDLRHDLDRAKVQSWCGCLNALLSHCENDPVMRVVVSPLNSHPRINVNSWIKEVDRRRLEGHVFDLINLPLEDDERTAFLNQFLRMICSGDFPYQSFCYTAFGSMELEDVVYSINSQFIDKFTREVAYRLEDIKTEIRDER